MQECLPFVPLSGKDRKKSATEIVVALESLPTKLRLGSYKPLFLSTVCSVLRLSGCTHTRGSCSNSSFLCLRHCFLLKSCKFPQGEEREIISKGISHSLANSDCKHIVFRHGRVRDFSHSKVCFFFFFFF